MNSYLVFMWRGSPGRWGWGRGDNTGLWHLYLGRVSVAVGTKSRQMNERDE